MRFQKITPVLAVVFVLALILSACNAVDMLDVNAAGKQSKTEDNISLANGLTLGQTRFIGSVVSIDSDRITVDDLVFRVDDNSKLPDKLTVGDVVNVDGLLLPDQSRYIVSLGIQSNDNSSDDDSGVEFKLYGQVDGLGDESWVVSGEVIFVDGNTQIGQSIGLTDLVEVEGHVVNGDLVAKKISLEDLIPGVSGSLTTTPSSTPSATETVTAGLQVEFYGILESMNGNSWVVGGKTLTILPQTEIKGQLLVGDFVKVHAWRQLDGSLIVREIEKDDDSNDDDLMDDGELKGIITSMSGNTWVIGGVTVLLDASTELSSNLKIGDFVEVEGTLQSDGSILAREVKLDDGSNDDSNDDS